MRLGGILVDARRGDGDVVVEERVRRGDWVLDGALLFDVCT